MPELPDITVYLEALEARVMGRALKSIRLANMFVLRTAVPPIDSLNGQCVVALRRIGKRLAFGFDQGNWLVIHLMVAGRLHWIEPGKVPKKTNLLASFLFETGTLTFTEASTKRRASIHVVADEAQLALQDPGGIDLFTCTLESFTRALTVKNHTLKRALTDPHLLSGLGNAYSDEILHAAKLSPVTRTQSLKVAEIERLLGMSRRVMQIWTKRLRDEAKGGFPEKVTAFRAEMAVHGKFGQPCPVCGTLVQRIVYAENEVNYCPKCQIGGRILADRSLSRLLKEDWPRTIDEAEGLTRAIASPRSREDVNGPAQAAEAPRARRRSTSRGTKSSAPPPRPATD